MVTHQHITVWQFIADKFSAGIPVILLYVLESEGSSPGRQGFKMAVSGDHDLCGTIGGGIMEHKFVEMAKARLQQDNSQQDIYRQVHDKKAGRNQSGMICSGEQTIFLYRITDADFAPVQALIKSATAFQNGTLELSHNGIRFTNKIPKAHFEFVPASEEECIIKEKTGFKNTLHIIGGGHCALALSKLMSDMDFYIRVYDERAGLNTIEQNIYAHQKTLLNTYSELSGIIESGNDTYVAVMTFGYRTDDTALRALAGKTFKYLGLLGSKNKMEKLFEEYRSEGISEAFLSQIHSPIGIQIKSKTTAEIAVSIAAEIISVKNR